jgi:hypothetical protein
VHIHGKGLLRGRRWPVGSKFLTTWLYQSRKLWMILYGGGGVRARVRGRWLHNVGCLLCPAPFVLTHRPLFRDLLIEYQFWAKLSMVFIVQWAVGSRECVDTVGSSTWSDFGSCSFLRISINVNKSLSVTSSRHVYKKFCISLIPDIYIRASLTVTTTNIDGQPTEVRDWRGRPPNDST